jgi:triacylglycerol lipase
MSAWRWFAWALAAVAAASLAVLLAGGPIAWPFDAALNLGGAFADGASPPRDGKARVVVLQHGLFRTNASLWRLERTLRAHGYDVLNPGYPSTRARVEVHAASLAAAIEARRARGAVDEWYFVGHSLGGLVIQAYLRSEGAVTPTRCVYLGTPHRGAVLADLRKHWFLFGLTMGRAASLQLSPGDPIHRQPLPYLDRSAALAGDLGERNPAIPGPDDGTVAVAEATMPGAVATLRVPFGHTRIAVAEPVLRQTLRFLADGAFAPEAAGK